MGAAPMSLWLPWAVHISDGVLRGPWLAAGFALAGVLVLLAMFRVRDEEIPRIALLSAAFFVATLMHLPLGPTRVHLLLNGLVGVVLGRRAPLAIVMGLALQAVLLGHGGFTTIGVNACVMTLPALLAAALFAGLRRLPWFGRGSNTITWLCGCLLGMVSVLATLVLQAIVLLWGGAEDWHQIVWLVFYAHLPIVALEGVVLGFTVNFLARVKPEMLGLSPEALRKWQDSSGIPPSSTKVIPSPAGESSEIRSAASSPPVALMLAALTLLFAARPALAHNAQADYLLLADCHVQIDGWYDPGGIPMKGAKVQVFRPGQRLLVEGRLNEDGSFVFRFIEVEPLEVVVNGGAGHRKSLIIPREKLEQQSQAEARPSGSGEEDSSVTVAAQKREHPDMWRERLKDALLGINFLLSAAAFLLSWRTSRRMRQREKES
jgi:cobalt/nickel transport system permease protein